jgi:replication factor C large subunit
MSLLDQFRPTSTSQLIGNPTAIKKLVKCIKEGKPCLVYGPAGVGKTSSVYAYAKEKNYKVEETNASDQRKKEDMEPLIRRLQCEIFFPTIFLLDEVDGAEHFNSIEQCIKYTKHPLVLICNDVYKIPQKILSTTHN